MSSTSNIILIAFWTNPFKKPPKCISLNHATWHWMFTVRHCKYVTCLVSWQYFWYWVSALFNMWGPILKFWEIGYLSNNARIYPELALDPGWGPRILANVGMMATKQTWPSYTHLNGPGRESLPLLRGSLPRYFFRPSFSRPLAFITSQYTRAQDGS